MTTFVIFIKRSSGKPDTTIPYIIINSRDYNTLKKERKANKSWGQLFYELGRNSNDIRLPIRRVRENNDNMTQNNI